MYGIFHLFYTLKTVSRTMQLITASTCVSDACITQQNSLVQKNDRFEHIDHIIGGYVLNVVTLPSDQVLLSLLSLSKHM